LASLYVNLQLTSWNAQNAVTNLGLFLWDKKEKELLTTLAITLSLFAENQ